MTILFVVLWDKEQCCFSSLYLC